MFSPPRFRGWKTPLAIFVSALVLLLNCVPGIALPADVLFEEDFENPDVPSYAQGITPDRWIRASQGYGSGDHGLTDKSGGDFSAPSGNEQAYTLRYTNSGITTKEYALGSPLAFGGGYEVSFDVVKDNSTGCRVAYKTRKAGNEEVQRVWCRFSGVI